MLKLFGAGLTMFSCFAAGCLICAEMKKRIHILEELRRMTVMLSAEIGYANTMLDEAFGKAGFTAAFGFSGTCTGKDAKRRRSESRCDL
mgnify:CR=1 FL=1